MTNPLGLPTSTDLLGGLARDLRDFTLANVAARIGQRAADALQRDDSLPAERTSAGQDPLGILIRLFLLGSRITEEDLHIALPDSAEQVVEWGIVTEEVRAGIDLRPTVIGEDDVWLASDLGEVATGRVLEADHVLGLGGASATLIDLTVRTPVARALDLGTGSGIQTLGLARHAEEIIATDISARALEFAAFNLALNDAITGDGGAQRVDLRRGSFFDAVEGDFDLIVSNPPFVVSPRASSLETYTYRDGGFVGDGVVRHLIEEIPARLRPGGVAQLLANWEVLEGQRWDERIGEWVRGTGLDAWVVQREYVDPAHYVHTWIRDGGLTPERDPHRYRSAYLEWLEDFDARGVVGIAFGYITLRRPTTDRAPWVRLEENTGTIGTGLGSVISTTLEVVDSLALTSDEELLDWHLSVAGDVGEERYHHPGQGDPTVILLRQGGGLARAVQVDTLGAAVVGACDGELTLGQICAALAHLLEVDEQRVADDVIPTVRGLLSDGVLVHTRPGQGNLST